MRVHYLTRTGMIPQAIDFILKENPKFEITREKLKEAEQTLKYDPKYGMTSKQYRKLTKEIDKYLDEHYLMYELDYTSEGDYGSRSEVILVCRKPVPDNEEYGKDFMYYSPDFTKDIIACFYR